MTRGTSFVIANGIVLAGVWLMFNQEMAALQNKVYAASDRIITSSWRWSARQRCSSER